MNFFIIILLISACCTSNNKFFHYLHSCFLACILVSLFNHKLSVNKYTNTHTHTPLLSLFRQWIPVLCTKSAHSLPINSHKYPVGQLQLELISVHDLVSSMQHLLSSVDFNLISIKELTSIWPSIVISA